MVKVLAIGDLHFVKDELALADLVIQKLTACIEETKPNMIVFLGDILHTHGKIDMKTLNKAVGFFKALAKQYPIFIVIGNHDRPDATTNLTDASAFYCLREVPNIYVIDRVLDIAYPINNDLKLRFVFVPYVPPGTFDRALATLQNDFHDQKNPVTCVFAHQTFVGASHGKTIVRSGDEWPLDNPLLISGHIHVHKVLQPNLIYAGTPYQLRYDDTSKKGVMLCNFNGVGDPDIRFVELDVRKKVAVVLTPEEVNNFVPPEGCEVKVEIKGNSDQIAKLNKDGIINRMRSKGVSVSLIPDRTNDPRNPEGKSYRALLEDSLKDDEEAMSIFKEIFENSDSRASPEVERKQELSHLMEIMKNINGGQASLPMESFKPEEVLSVKETPPYLINNKGKQEQPKPSLSELKNSLQASVKPQEKKPDQMDLQSLLAQAMSGATKK